MAAVELDPQFIKALRLLRFLELPVATYVKLMPLMSRSKSKDSGAQLRAMLDDAIRYLVFLVKSPPIIEMFSGKRKVWLPVPQVSLNHTVSYLVCN